MAMRKIEIEDASDPGGTKCPFCDAGRVTGALSVYGSVFAVDDAYLVTPGHLLIISRRHTPDFFSMTVEERSDAFMMIDELGRQGSASDPSVLDLNIGMNCGEAARQTVMHAHIRVCDVDTNLIIRKAQDEGLVHWAVD
jgi:diadenosine tetraphosphate (Ap4A) HIT family hydrolase